MAKSRINKELQEAVSRNDVNGVRRCLSAGANPNQRSANGWNNELLIHSTFNVDILKLLLKSGASVDARNKWSDTPLRTAIEKSKSTEFVEELLKQGAWVNATDRQGNTPLYLLMKRWGNPEDKVKLLLEYGADINTSIRDRSETSLCIAMHYPSVAKLLIRYTLLNNFSRNYTNIVNLTPYKNKENYEELSNYYKKCVAELEQMVKDVIIENCSLYSLITKTDINFDEYVNDVEKQCIRNVVFEVLIGCSYTIKYPIYYNNILVKIEKKILENRKNLLNMIGEIKIQTKNAKENAMEQYVALDFYTIQEIAKYLSNKDLLNLIIVFYKCTKTCAVQIQQMKKYIIADNCSLYDLISVETPNFDILFCVNDVGKKCISNEVFEILSDNSYNIYYDNISAKVGSGLLEERESLLHKISEIEVSSKIVKSVGEVNVVLDFYTKQEISKYLSNRDILSLSVAFYKCGMQCSNSNDSVITSTSESKNETSSYNDAKRVKLA